MNIFISWSGHRSAKLAEALRVWLPKVLQNLSPWASSQDIEKGARWLGEISTRLRESKFGLICVTPENQLEPWLLFEAGALSNALGTTLVAPVLLQMTASALKPPLSQFQATLVDKEDLRKLIRTLNSQLYDRPLPDTQLDESFDVWWPKLDELIQAIETPATASPSRSDREIMEETLTIARNVGRRLGVDKPPTTEPFRKLMMSKLTPREEKVIRMRLGVGEATNHTVEQVAEAFEVAPEKIRQIERRALRQLMQASPLGEKPADDEPAG